MVCYSLRWPCLWYQMVSVLRKWAGECTCKKNRETKRQTGECTYKKRETKKTKRKKEKKGGGYIQKKKRKKGSEHISSTSKLKCINAPMLPDQKTTQTIKCNNYHITEHMSINREIIRKRCTHPCQEFPVNDSMICAGEDKKGSCKGDSGGGYQ